MRFFIFLGALLVMLGYFLGTPYTLLAGGGPDQHLVAVLLTPLGALMLYIVYLMADGSRQMRWFWYTAVWFFLPIILNAASMLLYRVGAPNLGAIAFDWRYTVLWLPMIAWVALIFLKRARTDACDWWQRRQNPKIPLNG